MLRQLHIDMLIDLLLFFNYVSYTILIYNSLSFFFLISKNRTKI